MSILDSRPGLLTALSGEMTPKFLASRSADGMPNLVPVTSTMPAGDLPDRLIFGNFLLRKTVGNLDADSRVGILVITPQLDGWVLQADFQGWQRAGTYVDQLNSTELLRYNAYTGIRNAGILQVCAFLGGFRISKLRVLADYLAARLARPSELPSDAVRIPAPVRKRFAKMTKVGALAYLDGRGYPVAVPLLSLQPSGDRALVCALGLAAGLMKGLSPGTPVSASLLTLDVVSFQAKGRWLGVQRRLGVLLGAMAVTEVYAGGPPMPGRRIA